MNLLPKSKKEFSSKAYWENFFEKRKDAFEWYGEYLDVCELFNKYCKVSDKILMSGCGNSNLSEDMYDVGYHDIVNIDISDVVVKQMNTKSKGRMIYSKMDMKDTTFDDESFNVVIDKGTLDAIYSDDNIDILMGVQKMFTEILRVLKVVGRYICITLAQDNIMNVLLSFFPKWCFVRVHEIEIKKIDGGGLGSKLPVFAFVCTKMKSELASPVLEMVFSGSDRVEKIKVTDDIKRNIKTLQDFALIKNKMGSSSLSEEITVDLWTNDEALKEPRYSLTIIDILKNKLSTYNGDFAVFIVPNGRENNTMFATNSGRKSLAEAAGFTRLAIACLHRDHVYKDIEQIKSELSEKVMDLAPSNIDRNVQVPFLSTSSDIGNRVVVCKGESSVYGTFVVEDIQSEEQYYYRQLVLINKGDEVQSKTRLMSESNKKKKLKKRIPDHRYIIQLHEKSLLAGFSFISSLDFHNLKKMKVLVFGVHSVNFINFLMNLFPDIHVTCVGIDSNTLDVYRTWFGLNDTDQFTFVLKDIVSFSNECDEGVYDVVIVNHTPTHGDKHLCVFTEELFTEVNRILKTFGVLMRIKMDIHDSCEGCSHDITLPHFESKADVATIPMYVKCDVSLDVLWEQAKSKSKELVDYIMCKRKGFYNKQEWSSLIDVIENLSTL